MKLPKEAKKVFTGVIFDVYQWPQELFDGSIANFEMLQRPDSVNIIATVDKKIIVIEDDQPFRGSILSLPAGQVDHGEEPLAGAKRELLEETGHSSDTWKLLCHEQPYHKMDWEIYTYIAQGAKEVQAPHLDGGERIKVMFKTFDEFVELAHDRNFRIPDDLRHILWEALVDSNKKAELKAQLGL